MDFPIEASPANDGFAITESDTTVFVATALYVGTTGNVVLVTSRGTELTFIGVPAGTILPIRCKQVKTATTATDIIGLTY